jgi:hypothetical protein
VKFRPARGLGMALEEALLLQGDVRSFEGLMHLLRAGYDFWDPTPENVSIVKYGEGIDERCGWDTHLVCIDGKAALFTDGPLIGPQRPAK